MKQTITTTALLLLTLILTGCNEPKPQQPVAIKTKYGLTFEIIEVDHCEYVITAQGRRGYMAHKGNCKYCEERREKQLKYILEHQTNTNNNDY